MVQIPILAGIFADMSPAFRAALPLNMMAVPASTGISDGFLRPGDGVVQHGTGPGLPRGGIVWNGVEYRVMGTKFVSVTAVGGVTVLGDVGSGGYCYFDYSFDRLAITSGGRLYYWDGTTLTEVTDPDLGTALCVIWIDGYFMTTDGEFLVVTELTDPTQVNPLKYGSSEIDPDPVLRLLKVRNEVYALNLNTIEVFDNVGGELFPFQRNEGAQIPKGVIGTDAACVYLDTIAFLGSGRNEAPSIYLAASAATQPIATQEINELLLTYTDEQLASVILEARNDRSQQLLYVHLPDRTMVYDAAASAQLQQPVWVTLGSASSGYGQYRARDMLWCYNAWRVADPQSAALGSLTKDVSSHWDELVGWEFTTPIVYQDSAGAIMHRLELVALTGSIAFGENPRIATSYTLDGVTWSQDRWTSAGTKGQRGKRLVWLQQGNMRQWRIQRFQGTSDAHIAVARLEAEIEPLAW
jgi:hypothetical protein